MASKPSAKKQNLPSVSTLLNDSLSLLSKNLGKFIIWSLIGLAFFIVAYILLTLILIAVGWQYISIFLGKGHFTTALFTSLIIRGVIFLIIGTVVMGIIGTVFETGIILITANTKAASYKALIIRSIHFLIPLILIGIISGLIVLGGVFLFIIPGILFGLLLSLSMFEVILHGEPVLMALGNSVRIFVSNFWGILGRLFLLGVTEIIIFYLLAIFMRSSTGSSFFIITSILFRIIVVWFNVCYSLNLYQEARATVQLKQPTSLKWLVIPAILGWILVILISIQAIRFISSKGFFNFFRPLPQQEQNNQTYTSSQSALTHSAHLLQQIQKVSIFDKEPERTEKIKKLNDQNIAILKKSLLANPNDIRIWQVLCASYQLPNTTGTKQDKEIACKKAPLPTQASNG